MIIVNWSALYSYDVGGVQDDGVTEMAIFMYGNWTENGKLEVKLTKNRRKIDFEPKSVRRRADFGLFWWRKSGNGRSSTPPTPYHYPKQSLVFFHWDWKKATSCDVHTQARAWSVLVVSSTNHFIESLTLRFFHKYTMYKLHFFQLIFYLMYF